MTMAIDQAKPKFKRKQYLVSPKFQLKYSGIILLLMFITALMCSYVVYYTSMVMMGEKLASVYPQGRLVSIVKLVNLRILLSLILMSPVVIVIGILLSHKIAGPIFRIERFLNKMASGDFTSRISLRKGDELMTIAERMNSLSESLKGAISNHKVLSENALAEFNELKKTFTASPHDAPGIGERIKKLEGELKEMTKEFDRYKL